MIAIRRRLCIKWNALLALATLPCATLSAHSAGVLPDGGSQTTATIGASGKVTIGIAPPVAGVSHNTFTRFDVGRAGAEFANAGARVIVGEVTGTQPSLLEGPIAVSGARANLILANPNGISINGASFQNVGSVALSTGRVSFRDFAPAPGLAQRNVRLDTSAGTIEIGPDGLSGALINLELIARQVRVGGPVANTFTSPTARTRIVAGASRAEFDTAVSPTDNLSPWMGLAAGTASSPGVVLIDITALGSLSSGRIDLVVSDAGAGVRHAGSLLATAGDFTLAADGALHVLGGSLEAARDVTITVGAAEVRDATLLAGRAMLLESAGDIAVTGGVVQGSARNPADARSRGAVTLSAAGRIAQVSEPDGAQSAIFGAADDVVLTAGGDIVNRDARILSNANLRIAAGGDFENRVVRVGGNGGARQDFGRRARNPLGLARRTRGFLVDYGEQAAPGHQALMVAEGAVEIAARNIANRGGEIDANGGDVRLSAADTITNEALATGSVRFERSCRLLLCRTRAQSSVRVSGGLMNAGGEIELSAGRLIENVGGRVFAVGDIVLNAPTSIARGLPVYTTIERAAGM
jgi:filamentous hemagglutinin family protein